MKKLLATLLCLFAFPVLALDGTDILKKVDRNLEPESYEMMRKLINIEPNGQKKEFVLYSVKKGRDRIVALFLAPLQHRGVIRLVATPLRHRRQRNHRQQVGALGTEPHHMLMEMLIELLIQPKNRKRTLQRGKRRKQPLQLSHGQTMGITQGIGFDRRIRDQG